MDLITQPRRPVRSHRHRASGASGRIAVGVVAFSLAISPATVEAEPAPKPITEIPTGLPVDRIHAPDEQLRDLIATLLRNNPQILSSWSRSRSTLERVSREKALPDAQFSYRYFAQTPETRVGPQEHGLELTQSVPWGGKRELQSRRAESLASGAGWEARDLEWRLVSELKRAYFESAYLQEAITVNAEEQEILRRFEIIALRRYSTGQGIQQSVVKVQTEISRLEDRAAQLRQQSDTVRRRISALIGRPESPLELRPIELPLPEVAFDRESLEQVAVEAHPRVRAVEQRVEADRIWAESRKLESRPDFRFGVGYVFVGDREDLAGRIDPPEDNGKDILALTVGINIPLDRRRSRAGVAEARESERAGEQLLDSVRDRLRYEIQEGLLRAESLSERGRLFLEVIIPQAEESLASAEAAYTTDRLGFLDLLDAERVLFQSRLAYHRLVSDLWIALADLEVAVSGSLPIAHSGAGSSS
jgi:outer membrane protein TolC